MIEVKELTKQYGSYTAIEGVSFAVEKGEILGFLGPNGAGKTTTMRILTCYMPATKGTAKVAGYDVFEESLEVRRRIGYLPEHPPLYTDMGVESYLTFMAKLKKVPKKKVKGRVQEVMEMVQIQDVAKKLIGKLSKGYRQRVGLGQAIIHDPDVLVLDEPTSGLDPKQITEVRHLIKNLRGEHTIILSTHILPEVEMICDRVVIIDKGKVVAQDTPKNLVEQIKGSEQLLVQVRGDQKEVVESLSKIEGVAEVTINNHEEDWAKLTVRMEMGKEKREEIAKTIVENHWGLLELRPMQISLEDVFLKLITEEKKEEVVIEPKREEVVV